MSKIISMHGGEPPANEDPNAPWVAAFAAAAKDGAKWGVLCYVGEDPDKQVPGFVCINCIPMFGEKIVEEALKSMQGGDE